VPSKTFQSLIGYAPLQCKDGESSIMAAYLGQGTFVTNAECRNT
jgi:hypothetical protein